MALHVQDAETDRLVRDFARRRRLGITDAIRFAVTEVDKHERESVDALLSKIAPLQARAARFANLRTTDVERKAMLDAMWGH